MTEPSPSITHVITRDAVNPHWLKYRRQQAGLRQVDIAQRLGVSKSYICAIEAGRVCSERARLAYEAL